MAAGDDLIKRGTTVIWKSSGGQTWTPTSLGSGAGRLGARYDWGADPRPDYFEIVAIIKAGSTPTTGLVGRIYWVGAEDATGATRTDGYHTESDQAVTDEDRLRNCSFVDVVIADEGTVFNKPMILRNTRRYGAPCFWNALGQSLSSTAADCEIRVTPIWRQIQSS